MDSSFDTLLKSLHNNDVAGQNTDMIVGSATANLVVDAKRQFSPVNDFDTIIGYEGDINSQIIVIELPETHKGHHLSKCGYKELKWKNLSNGVEGISTLVVKNVSPTLYEWQVPADIMSAAGTIEIYISIYDKIGTEPNTQIAFAWNTAPYSGLSIGKTMSSVGSHYPARDEILVINKDTKQIVAPMGYNNIICNYGDIGAEVYFLVDRQLGKGNIIDVNDSNTQIAIYVVMNGCRGIDNNPIRIEKQLYTEQIGEDTNGLVLLTWKVPAGITSGVGGANTLQIMLQFENGEQRWSTNIYSKLKVGESLFSIGEIPEGDFPLTQDLIESIVQNYLDNGNFVEDYFNNTNVIIDANIE